MGVSDFAPTRPRLLESGRRRGSHCTVRVSRGMCYDVSIEIGAFDAVWTGEEDCSGCLGMKTATRIDEEGAKDKGGSFISSECMVLEISSKFLWPGVVLGVVVVYILNRSPILYA